MLHVLLISVYKFILIAIFHNLGSTTTLLQDGTRNTDLLIRTLDVIEVSVNLYKNNS